MQTGAAVDQTTDQLVDLLSHGCLNNSYSTVLIKKRGLEVELYVGVAPSAQLSLSNI